MKELNYIIHDQLGIHARPAGLLVKQASMYQSEITISKGSKSADLKKIFGIMTLGVKQGEEVVIKITGEDEDEAWSAIGEFLRENL